MTFTPAIDPDIEYPDSDGKPMADNTEQYEWIVKIKENLEILFATSPNVFIAGDLLWYPVQDKKITGPVAPDIMVVFGRPKGRRGSYKQWQEDNIAPQVTLTSQIWGQLGQGNGIRLHPHALETAYQWLKHFICMYYGCVMHSGVVYSLNNDTTTSF